MEANISDADLNRVIESLKGKPLHELIASGVKKVGATGGVPAAKTGAPAKEEKKDDKKEAPKKEAPKKEAAKKVEEAPIDDDFGLGGGLFD